MHAGAPQQQHQQLQQQQQRSAAASAVESECKEREPTPPLRSALVQRRVVHFPPNVNTVVAERQSQSPTAREQETAALCSSLRDCDSDLGDRSYTYGQGACGSDRSSSSSDTLQIATTQTAS